jgi:hypothetical protein
VPGAAQKGGRGQTEGGQAEVHGLEEGLPALEEPLPPFPLEGQVHDKERQAELQHGQRVERPVLLSGGGQAPAHRAARHLERGHPQGRGQAHAEEKGGQRPPCDSEAGCLPAAPRAEVAGDQHGRHGGGHGRDVGRARQRLERRQQPPAEHVTRPSLGGRRALRGFQHPRHPRRRREVVPHVGERDERPGQHPDRGGHERPAGPDSQAAGQPEEAGACQHEVPEHERRVNRAGRQDQVDPREGVEHLGVGLGQHRLAERHPRVPHRPAAGGHGPDEGLHLGEPVGQDVALEEHAPEHEREEGS